jgi:hypothetical protein
VVEQLTVGHVHVERPNSVATGSVPFQQTAERVDSFGFGFVKLLDVGRAPTCDVDACSHKSRIASV